VRAGGPAGTARGLAIDMILAPARRGVAFARGGRYIAPPPARHVMAKVNPLEFLRQVRQEASRVTWPSRRETTVTTGMVFLMVIVAAMFFFLIDQGLGMVVRWALNLGT
jgi:preprotein translocase subunit SecE